MSAGLGGVSGNGKGGGERQRKTRCHWELFCWPFLPVSLVVIGADVWLQRFKYICHHYFSILNLWLSSDIRSIGDEIKILYLNKNKIV